MIEINRRSQNSKYTSKGVLVTINHSLEKNLVVQLLDAFYKEYGVEALRDVLADAGLLECILPPIPIKPKSGDLFFVLVDGPTHGHFDMNSALAEAKRLAVKEKKNTYVIKRLTRIEPVCGPVSLNVYDI